MRVSPFGFICANAAALTSVPTSRWPLHRVLGGRRGYQRAEIVHLSSESPRRTPGSRMGTA